MRPGDISGPSRPPYLEEPLLSEIMALGFFSGTLKVARAPCLRSGGTAGARPVVTPDLDFPPTTKVNATCMVIA